GVNAFNHNTALESVSFGTGLVTIDDYAFYNCPELQTVTFKESATPLLAINPYAFANAVKLTTLTFSESLKTINYGAFAGCISLETLLLPNSLTTITGTGNITSYRGAFNGCTALKSVTFGSGLVTIGNGYGNVSDYDPDSYASTGAFGNCSSLETVAFRGNIETIGNHAFSECIKLKALETPNSIQTIGVNAFYHNVNLSRVEFGSDLRSIGSCAFARCTALATISFAATTYYSLNIGAYAFMDCNYLTTLTLSDAITTISSGAFSDCSLLRRITIPSVISKVGNNVFANFERLNEVDFAGLPPENIENAGLPVDIKIRYSSEYAEEWTTVVEQCGFSNATEYDPSEAITVIGGDSRYELSNEQSDRSIASITINADTAIDTFILTHGKVYDSVLRIVNTADSAVALTLPSGYVYETFEGADPLTIPANSRNLLTITRTEENVFLVSREKLRVIQQ
ncbi:MAG: leucine-rich repeat domain-containing protein, partial [Kiritimatiellae bacterium]|nr:leucine-rich repeat domain-containing protein [Kiritimatiellia bacterium]